jgi:hypothetical protein
MELMTRLVGPASPDSDVVKDLEGRYVDQEEERTCHQGPKARRCLHDEAGYTTASVPIRAAFKSPLTSQAGPYMTMPFKELYKNRAGVEGTISQAVFACGIRPTRYRGVIKTHLQHLATAAAIHLQRFVGWWWDVPRSVTCKSPVARLAPSTWFANNIYLGCTRTWPTMAVKRGGLPMNILLFSMPDSFEHMPSFAIRLPNGALTSLAGNVDPYHRVAVADLILV